jgi:hypothetical protein
LVKDAETPKEEASEEEVETAKEKASEEEIVFGSDSSRDLCSTK